MYCRKLPARPFDELVFAAEFLGSRLAPERHVVDRLVHGKPNAGGGTVTNARHRQATAHEAVLERNHPSGGRVLLHAHFECALVSHRARGCKERVAQFRLSRRELNEFLGKGHKARCRT